MKYYLHFLAISMFLGVTACASVPETTITGAESSELNMYVASVSGKSSTYTERGSTYGVKKENTAFVEITLVFENKSGTAKAVFLPAVEVAPRMHTSGEEKDSEIPVHAVFYGPCCGWEGFKKSVSLWWNEGRGETNIHFLEIPANEKRAVTLVYVVKKDSNYTKIGYTFDMETQKLADEWSQKKTSNDVRVFASPRCEYAQAALSLTLPSSTQD